MWQMMCTVGTIKVDMAYKNNIKKWQIIILIIKKNPNQQKYIFKKIETSINLF